MDREELLECILDSMSTQIVFIDRDFVVRFVNREARYQNYEVLGYEDIMGHSILDCHKTERARQMIQMAAELFEKNAPEMASAHPTGRNEIIYTVPVRDEKGKYLGMYERFEMNLRK